MIQTILVASREQPLEGLTQALLASGRQVKRFLREDIDSVEKLTQAMEGVEAPDELLISSLCDASLEGKNWAELTTEEYIRWKYFALSQFYELNAVIVSRMIDRGGGKVLGILSEAGVIPTKNQCMNGGAGAALAMGIQCMAEETHSYGVYANAVAIGTLKPGSEIRATVNDPETMNHMPSRQALDENEVIARVVDVLNMTGPVLTGNILTLDGGFSCAYMREW